MKTLDRKLGAILRGGGARGDFIIADAKDADMGGGRPAPGPERGADGRPLDAVRPLAGYLDEIRAITSQGIVDVMLVSSSTLERLGTEGFESSPVTPAIRANDTTDIWGVRGGGYPLAPSRPFRTASLPNGILLARSSGVSFSRSPQAVDSRLVQPFSPQAQSNA